MSEAKAPSSGWAEQEPITERARLLSKAVAEVDDDPSNVLFQYTGGAKSLGMDPNRRDTFSAPFGEISYEPPGVMEFRFTLPHGKRLVIDNIFKDRKEAPMGPDCQRQQVHIYENPEGYLVADKVVDGHILKKRPRRLERTEDGLQVAAEEVTARAMDSPVAGSLANDRKQRLPSGKTQLITTTTTWTYPERPGMYSDAEITVRAPDDAGRELEVDVVNLGHGAFPEPIYFRLVDDTQAIAGPEEQ